MPVPVHAEKGTWCTVSTRRARTYAAAANSIVPSARTQEHTGLWACDARAVCVCLVACSKGSRRTWTLGCTQQPELAS